MTSVTTSVLTTVRYMFNDDGTFHHGHINNWQHAAMYFAYMIAGIVDIAGTYSDLPEASEQVCASIIACTLFVCCQAALPSVIFITAIARTNSQTCLAAIAYAARAQPIRLFTRETMKSLKGKNECNCRQHWPQLLLWRACYWDSI